jgi:hypothetical protein
MNTLKMMITASLISGNLLAANIPVIGLDAKGNALEEAVSEMEFSGWMKKAATASSEIVNDDQQLKTQNQAGLKLQQVDIGLGFKAEVGLGDVLKASAEPTITFHFKRSH